MFHVATLCPTLNSLKLLEDTRDPEFYESAPVARLSAADIQKITSFLESNNTLEELYLGVTFCLSSDRALLTINSLM